MEKFKNYAEAEKARAEEREKERQTIIDENRLSLKNFHKSIKYEESAPKARQSSAKRRRKTMGYFNDTQDQPF